MMSASSSAASAKPLNVLITTPLGEGGKGGIDRLMDSLRPRVDQARDEGAIIRFATTRGAGSILLSPFYLAAFACRLIALKVVGKVDLLHLNVSKSSSFWRKFLISRLALVLRVPYVVQLHSGNFAEFYHDGSAVRRRCIESLFQDAGMGIVLGKYWRTLVREIAPSLPVSILYNATAAIPKVDRRGDIVEILFLGLLGKGKGVPDLVDAVSLLPPDLPWRLTIAGNGEISETKAKVDQLSLSDRVAIPGWVGPEEGSALLGKADIVVLPSYAENLPMSVIEGMGAEAAVVATPVGAVPDIMTDGENGLLIQPGDVDGLATALRRLVEDDELRSTLGRNARSTHREMLDIRTYLPRLVHLWKAALQGEPDR